MSELETHRKQALMVLDEIRENVKKAVKLEGDLDMERPSLHPIWNLPYPPEFGGANHIRYTLQLDLLLPHSSKPTAKEEGSLKK